MGENKIGDFNIRFREMSDNEFEKFIESSVLDYSHDLIKSGLCSEENAFDSAKNQFNALLSQGKNTKDNFICVVENSEKEDVGVIWYNKYQESISYICDILIFENFRKKGYGKQTLLFLEDEVKEKGYNKILLHVFKFNKTAISLYDSLGYKVVKEDCSGMYMMKDL